MILGGLTGFGVMFLLCALPIVHFLTAWPSPLIGGFIGGSKSHADLATAVGIGVFMSVCLLIPLFPILLIFGGSTLAIFVSVPVFFYVVILATIGAQWGGRLARKMPVQKRYTITGRNIE